MFHLYTADELSAADFYAETEHISVADVAEVFMTSPASWRYADAKEKTRGMVMGKTARANFLDQSRFESEFYRMPVRDEYPHALATDSDIKSWLKDRGIAGYSGKKFPELLEMVKKTGEPVQIWKEIEQSAAEEAGKRVAVPGQDYDACMMMRNVLMNNAAYRPYLTSGYKEVSIFGVLEGVKVKCRLDCVTPDATIIGYHTTSSARPEDFDRKAPTLGYYLRKAMEYDMFTAAHGKPKAIKILAQEKTSPFLPMLFPMKPEQITIGRVQYLSTLSMLRACMERDIWPGYAGGVAEVELQTPAYLLKIYKEYLGETK